uniref:Uncharacterized protein n=1 Tax=Siphoviridae sp. ctBLh2 TaxID=2827803 RepID=A0A8S5S3G5_9CAUD|nr:MAG TPA: hypothetical protein [Siphoviridae sp. ctBLh2]
MERKTEFPPYTEAGGLFRPPAFLIRKSAGKRVRDTYRRRTVEVCASRRQGPS